MDSETLSCVFFIMYEDNRYVVLTSKCFNSNDPQLIVRNGNGGSAFGL